MTYSWKLPFVLRNPKNMSNNTAAAMRPEKLKIGQIRRVWIEYYGPALVCVAQVFTAANLAEVIVIHPEPDRAASRDFIAEPDGTNLLFSIVLSPDLIFSLDHSVLEVSPVHGQICQQCVSDIFRQSFLRMLPESYVLNKGHTCLYAGNYEMSLLDRSWVIRSKLIEAISSVSLDFLDYDSFVEERVRLFTLISTSKSERLSYRKLINQMEGNGNVESINLLLERVTTSHYARALVRC
jgi:hypothetical protein